MPCLSPFQRYPDLILLRLHNSLHSIGIPDTVDTSENSAGFLPAAAKTALLPAPTGSSGAPANI